MKAVFRKSGLSSLTPVDHAAVHALSKIKPDQQVLCEIKRPRNIRQHRLWWALMQKIADNMDGDFSAETVCQVIKIRAGHVQVVRTRTGEVFIPKSISFGSMPQDEFSAFMERAIGVICTDILPGLSSDDLRREISEIISGQGAE
jgi:hypothetical protein